jgi:hypothetical protein
MLLTKDFQIFTQGEILLLKERRRRRRRRGGIKAEE